MEELGDSSSMEQDTMIVLYDECADLQRRLIEIIGNRLTLKVIRDYGNKNVSDSDSELLV